MAKLKKSEVPALVRKLVTHARKVDEENRKAMRADLKMVAGGAGQWDTEELNKRKASNRPAVSMNKVAMPVDHIENEVRQNPPGPMCHPVGGVEDDGMCDIIEGLIRETEYRSKAYISYESAAGVVAGCGLSALQLTTEYVNPLVNDDQQMVIEWVEDGSTVYWDPSARKFDRSDAMWSARVRALGKEAYEAKYGKKRDILGNRNTWSQSNGWIPGDMPILTEWSNNGKGPYWVVEFYWIEVERVKMQMFSNNIAYQMSGQDDDTPEPPKGAKPRGAGWEAQKRTVWMYVCDALEVLEEPVEWLGSRTPLFPILGKEIWIEGECTRKSLIRDQHGSQKGLNYAASEMLTLAGTISKNPWTGPAGVFGNGDKWDTANSELWSFIEWFPQFYPDPNGQMHMGPGPERNPRIAEVDSSLKMCAFFADQIQSGTGMLDPSRQLASSDNSGTKVQQLQQQGQLGSLQYQDNVMRAVGSMYDEMLVIFPKILDAARAMTIIRADGKAEQAQINQEFGEAHPKTGKRRFYDMKGSLGKYGVRCNAGPNSQTRRDAAITTLSEFFKNVPQAIQSPKMMAQFLRMIAEGNPAVEQMADILDPPLDGSVTPEMLQGQLAQSQQQNQAMKQVIQVLDMKLKAGLPEIEYKRWAKAIDFLENRENNITKLAAAEITSSKDADQSLVSQVLQFAHERGMQAEDHEQAQQTQQADQQHQQAMPAVTAAAQPVEPAE